MGCRSLVRWSIVALMAVGMGCAPRIDHLIRHLDRGQFKLAVDATEGDRRLQQALAALVLERAAVSGERPEEMVIALATAGDPGKQSLKRLVTNGRQPGAQLAEIALLQSRLSPSDDDLDRFMNSDYQAVRSYAAQSWYSKIDFDRLSQMRLDPAPRVRLFAIRGLALMADTEAVAELLAEALRLDPDPKVRAAAARNGNVLGTDAYLSLKRALRDENLGVTLAAVQGLGRLDSAEARHHLHTLAIAPFDVVAIAAAAELARLGEETGRRRLAAALTGDRATWRATALLKLERAQFVERQAICLNALADKSPKVVLIAASLLLSHPSKHEPVGRALRRLVEQKSRRAEEARDMLAVLGDSAAIEQVTTALNSRNGAEIVQILRRVTRADGLRDAFISLIGHNRAAVRIAAAKALLKTPPKS